jgi:hypothetical protein
MDIVKARFDVDEIALFRSLVKWARHQLATPEVDQAAAPEQQPKEDPSLRELLSEFAFFIRFPSIPAAIILGKSSL